MSPAPPPETLPIIPSDPRNYRPDARYEHLTVEDLTEVDRNSVAGFSELAALLDDFKHADHAEDTQHGFFEIYRGQQLIFVIKIQAPYYAIYARRPGLVAANVNFATAPGGNNCLEYTYVTMALSQCLPKPGESKAGEDGALACKTVNVKLITREIPGTREHREGGDVCLNGTQPPQKPV